MIAIFIVFDPYHFKFVHTLHFTSKVNATYKTFVFFKYAREWLIVDVALSSQTGNTVSHTSVCKGSILQSL